MNWWTCSSKSRLFFGVFVALLAPYTTAATSLRRRQDDVSIHNGSNAPEGAYPFFAEVRVVGVGTVCGGTVIHHDAGRGIVLTAAHCQTYNGNVVPHFLYRVKLRSNQQEYRVQKALPHPEFQPHKPNLGNDLLLLYFEVEDDEDPLPVVTLNSDPHFPNTTTTQPVTLCGMGFTGGGPNIWDGIRPTQLQQATDLQLVKEDCDLAESLCTVVGPSHAQICLFDSGSPLLVNNSTQVGIVSIGDRLDTPTSNHLCIHDKVGYTRISNHYDWIQQQILVQAQPEPATE